MPEKFGEKFEKPAEAGSEEVAEKKEEELQGIHRRFDQKREHIDRLIIKLGADHFVQHGSSDEINDLLKGPIEVPPGPMTMKEKKFWERLAEIKKESDEADRQFLEDLRQWKEKWGEK
jgi:hypothetical protein